jgi:hypothetical protein
MYGLTYFEVTNKKGTKLWLGVHNLGMDIYEYHNKCTTYVLSRLSHCISESPPDWAFPGLRSATLASTTRSSRSAW